MTMSDSRLKEQSQYSMGAAKANINTTPFNSIRRGVYLYLRISFDSKADSMRCSFPLGSGNKAKQKQIIKASTVSVRLSISITPQAFPRSLSLPFLCILTFSSLEVQLCPVRIKEQQSKALVNHYYYYRHPSPPVKR